MATVEPKQHDVWSTTDGRKVYLVAGDEWGEWLQLSYDDHGGWHVNVEPLKERLAQNARLRDFAAYDTGEVVRELAQIPNS